jgi:hypothetical protein
LELYEIDLGQSSAVRMGEDKLEDLANRAVQPQGLRTPQWRVVRASGLPVVSGYNLMYYGDNRGATTENFETGQGERISGRSVWYALDNAEAGVWTLSTEGSDFDTLLQVFYYSNSIPYLWLTDDNSGSDGRTSWLRFEAGTDLEYRVRVAGLGSGLGQYRLTMRYDRPQQYDQWNYQAGEGYGMELVVPRGAVFTIEGSEDLRVWERIISTQAPTGLYEFRDGDSWRHPQRFYRALVFP